MFHEVALNLHYNYCKKHKSVKLLHKIVQRNVFNLAINFGFIRNSLPNGDELCL